MADGLLGEFGALVLERVMVEFDHACAHAAILYHKAAELLVKDLDLNLSSAIKMVVQVKVSLQG